MASKLKATLRGIWWSAEMSRIQRCFVCGGKLEIKFVKPDKRRRRVCVLCSHITYVNPKVVAGVVLCTRDGRLVLLKRDNEPAKGKWSYPAGYQEMGESVMEAAIREAKEEVGVDIILGELIGVYSYADAGVVTVIYEGRVKGNQKPFAGQEASDVALYEPTEIPWKQLAFRSTIDALKDWKKKKGLKK